MCARVACVHILSEIIIKYKYARVTRRVCVYKENITSKIIIFIKYTGKNISNILQNPQK